MWDWWDDTVDAVSDAIGGAVEWVNDQVDTYIYDSGEDEAALEGWANDWVDYLIWDTTTAEGKLEGWVRDQFDIPDQEGKGFLDEAAEKAGDIYNYYYDEGDTFLNVTGDKITDGAAAAAAKAGDIINNISIALGAFFDGAMAAITELPGKITEFVEPFTSAITDFKGAPSIAGVNKLFTGVIEAIKNADSLGDTEEGSVYTEARRAFIMTMARVGMITGAPMGFLPVIGDVYSAGLGQIIKHDAAQVFRPELLPPASLVEAEYRGIVTADKVSHDTARLGFGDAQIKALRALYVKLEDINTLRQLKLRGHIDDDRVATELKAQGYPEDDVSGLMELFNLIPGIQDLILMAVREAFTPEIAERFGQYEDYPEELTKWAAKQGLSEEWSKRYWASHWGLPSAQLGFEMLHRGIISMDDLKLLLRAQDVMPFWRKGMVQVAYTPFTRVDVRRMHKAKVLDDLAVFTAYADVGFSPFAPGCEHETVALAFVCDDCRRKSKCGLMLDFTKAFNADPPEQEKDEKDKERDLTKTDILTGLRDGLLEESEATGALGLLGYDTDEVTYYLAKIDYQRDKDELSDSTHYLHDAYIKGVITFAEVTDELGKLNLPAKMTDYYLKVWDLEKIARTNKPTKSELMTFLRKGIVDETTWRAEMVGLGYPNRYIDWYAAGEVEVA
ncbi:hypothetical protein ES708_08942 [subsurface metagenome]